MADRQQQEPGAATATEEVGRRRHVFWLTLLVVVWALELLALQELTAAPNDDLSFLFVVKHAARRTVLNVSACLFLACVLNRFWLYVTFGAGFLISNVLVVYAAYFGSPLPWMAIEHQWSEGLAVSDHGISLLRWPIVLLLLAAVLVKVGLREKLHRHLDPSLRLARHGWTAAAVYLGFAIGLAGYYKPISKLVFGPPEYAYGYVVAWCAESLVYDEAAILRAAIEAANERSDRLSPQETPLEFGGRISIVQVESLDWDVLDAQVEGEWVMPFLRDLRTRSMAYKIRPIHETGTSDADFALLTGMKPNGKVIPYRVRSFPYQDTLPLLARERGYQCIALHGNEGSYFDRRSVFKNRLGFSKVGFEEELCQLGCEMSGGGVTDEALLRLSAQWMRETHQPTVHFIITFTSHGPFNRLPAERQELFPHPASQVEAYLNSMRYVDRVLESYLQALPQGTTLVLYGDHGSGVYGYVSGQDSEERVPWLIHCKGQNMAPWQQTRHSRLARSGELGLLDLATYLHGNLQRSSGAARGVRLTTRDVARGTTVPNAPVVATAVHAADRR